MAYIELDYVAYTMGISAPILETRYTASTKSNEAVWHHEAGKDVVHKTCAEEDSVP